MVEGNGFVCYVLKFCFLSLTSLYFDLCTYSSNLNLEFEGIDMCVDGLLH